MRLIDADALVYSRVRIAHEDGTIGGYNAVVMSSEINHTPTVEAIPIDWVADWLAYNQKRIDDGENADDSVEWMLRAWFMEQDIEKERKKRRERNESSADD